MVKSEIYRLEGGGFLVISAAGIRTIVDERPTRQAGDPHRTADYFRAVADAIDRAAEATAPMLIPNVARSVST